MHFTDPVSLSVDHFSIQVDNPMTVLTQDQSRQFLANSSPKDKYNVSRVFLQENESPSLPPSGQFFLRGTQLAQLTTEYEVIRVNLEQMNDNLRRKTESIPEIKEKYKRAKQRATEATAAIGQQDKIELLKYEIAWSYVNDTESVRSFFSDGNFEGRFREITYVLLKFLDPCHWARDAQQGTANQGED